VIQTRKLALGASKVRDRQQSEIGSSPRSAAPSLKDFFAAIWAVPFMLGGDGDGLPGTDYAARLTWRNVVLTPAEARKYDHALMHQARPAGPLAHRFIGEPKARRIRS
jgi:hypothetical protein